MAILLAKKVLKRDRAKPRLHTQLGALTPAEQANVLALAKELRARYRSWEAFTEAAGVRRLTLYRACTGLQPPCAGLARLANVSVEKVLGGMFAKPWTAPCAAKSGT